MPTLQSQGRKLVAHLDTGNSAKTVIYKDVFDYLFPNAGKPLGYDTIRGVTGVPVRLPIYNIQYTLEGVKSQNGSQLKVSCNALVQARRENISYDPTDYDLLLSSKDLALFGNYGYTIDPRLNQRLPR